MTEQDGADRAGKGALGLSLSDVGEVVQSLGSVLVDRGFDRADVERRLTAETFDEGLWWEAVGGPLVDGLAEVLGFEDSFPQGEEVEIRPAEESR